MTKAVITGDIVDSSKYSEEGRVLILNTMHDAIEYLEALHPCSYTLFRGDSIQGLLESPAQALWHAMYVKSTLKALHMSDKPRSSIADIRLAIGIGEVDFLRERLEESDGQAFQFSGRTLDKMKSSGRGIALKTKDDGINQEWQVILGLVDVVLDKWSVSSAEVARELLRHQSDTEVIKKLNISQPAVSLRKKHAGWEALKSTMSRFEKIMSEFN